VGRRAQQALAVEEDLARLRAVEARDAVEERCLARAVGPDDAEDGALGDVEGDAVEGYDASEADAELADGKQRAADDASV
jgi:hypothetical protein